MGALVTKPFEKSEVIPGQGRALLLDCKALGVRTRQLDRLYEEFCRFEDVKSYTVDVESMLSTLNASSATWGPIVDVLFLQFDEKKSGELFLHDFVLTLWNFLTVPDGDMLANFVFQLFDVKSNNVIEVFEVKFLIHMVWKFAPSRATSNALKKLDLNDDGLVTVAEFILLHRHFPVILEPIVKLRNLLRKRIAFSRFWKEMSDTRKAQFHTRSIFDVLDRSDIMAHDRRFSALEHVASLQRGDAYLPVAYADKWRDVNKKKEDLEEKKSQMDLPDELLTDEEKRLRQERQALAVEAERARRKGLRPPKRSGPHLDFSDDEALLNDDEGDRVTQLLSKLSKQKFTSSPKRKSSKVGTS
jgi:Ca2+-binding EF-hand superfamily protein